MKKMNQQGVSHILLVILVVVVLGGIGFAGWKVMQAQKKTTSQNTNPQNQTQTLSASDILQNVRSKLTSHFTVSSAKTTDLPAGSINIQSLKNSPIWQPAGYNFYVDPDTGTELDVSYNSSTQELAKTNSSAVTNTIVNTLTTSGLTKASSHFASDLDPQDFYVSASVVCAVTSTSQEINPASVICDQLSSYAPAAAKLRPFYDVYMRDSKSAAQTGQVAFVGNPTVTNSKTPGYKLAQVEVTGGGDGFAALFYSKGSQWHFFTGTQMTIDCSEFNTQDLRLAYAGHECYDANTQKLSTVQ